MKSLVIGVTCLMLIACQSNTQEKVSMKTQMDSVSYGIGLDIGKNLKAQSIDVNAAAIAAGIHDATTGGKTLLTDEEVQKVMTEFQQQLMAKTEAKAREMGEKNAKLGAEFLAANKSKEGIKTTPSGLQYKILTAGTGVKPTTDQTVTVHYRGTLIDGMEFENSYKRGQPTTLPVTQFVKGWVEALVMMPVGSKWQLFIPSDLAYGERSPGASIPPNAVLIFELELLAVK